MSLTLVCLRRIDKPEKSEPVPSQSYFSICTSERRSTGGRTYTLHQKPAERILGWYNSDRHRDRVEAYHNLSQ